jgi:hypothetical protein
MGESSALRLRVAAAFFAAAEPSAWVREAWDLRPPLADAAWRSAMPRPEPLSLPPLSLVTLTEARRPASGSETPRCA